MKCSFFFKLFAVLALVLLLGVLDLFAEEVGLAQADRLLSNSRLNFQQARQALTLYEEMLPRAKDLQERISIQVSLARACFIAGDLAPKNQKSQRLDYFKKGEHYAALLEREEPHGAAGPYWLAMSLLGMADVRRGMKALGMLPRIVKEMERSLAVDSGYDQAGAHRVLGRIYYEAPGWPLSVGDIRKSYRHLTEAVRLAPANSTNHLYLAETLIRMGKRAEACKELGLVLKSCSHAIRPQLLDEDRREARGLLQDCGEARPQVDAPVLKALPEPGG
jgi:tetratricopeptide (TPR) repeat protein